MTADSFGDSVVSATGEIYTIENRQVEIVEKPATVYNFKVEDFHTYHVGNLGVLVHNADCAKEDMLGANGTQVSSKTSWKNGKIERIDVENPAPGKRPGQIHYHDTNNKKYYYDIKNNVFYNQKTGELAPKSVQNLLKNHDFMKGTKNALQILGE